MLFIAQPNQTSVLTLLLLSIATSLAFTSMGSIKKNIRASLSIQAVTLNLHQLAIRHSKTSKGTSSRGAKFDRIAIFVEFPFSANLPKGVE
jgi:hypothetical protein